MDTLHSHTPRVSVLMAVYNAHQYLEAAIQSIQGQHFRDWEFVIIDDGSTDGSLEILRRIEQQDHRIRVTSRPNTGLVGALNEALGLSRGELVARMDADDLCMSERFDKQIAYLDIHPECVAVGCRSLWIDPHGQSIGVVPQAMDHGEIIAGLLRGNGNAITHAASMYRRSALVEVGAYRPRYETAEDLDLFLRLSERGQLANLPDVLYQYRQHPGSINHTRHKQQERAIREAVAEACARRNIQFRELDVGWRGRPTSMAGYYQLWCGMALENGYPAAARTYSWKTVCARPLSRASWKLLGLAFLPGFVRGGMRRLGLWK